MLQLFTQAGVVAWPLGVCSILALAIILERVFTLGRLRRLEERAFMMLQLGLEKQDDEMLADPQIAGAPVAQVIKSVAPLRGGSVDSIEQNAEIALSLQRLRMRRYLGTLATIGANAPFVGLFGTVLGVMHAFAQMSTTQLSGEKMASGISEALAATALGLLVAIPAVIAYNFLVGRVTALLLVVQGHTAKLTPMLYRGVPEKQESSIAELAADAAVRAA